MAIRAANRDRSRRDVRAVVPTPSTLDTGDLDGVDPQRLRHSNPLAAVRRSPLRQPGTGQVQSRSSAHALSRRRGYSAPVETSRTFAGRTRVILATCCSTPVPSRRRHRRHREHCARRAAPPPGPGPRSPATSSPASRSWAPTIAITRGARRVAPGRRSVRAPPRLPPPQARRPASATAALASAEVGDAGARRPRRPAPPGGSSSASTAATSAMATNSASTSRSSGTAPAHHHCLSPRPTASRSSATSSATTRSATTAARPASPPPSQSPPPRFAPTRCITR